MACSVITHDSTCLFVSDKEVFVFSNRSSGLVSAEIENLLNLTSSSHLGKIVKKDETDLEGQDSVLCSTISSSGKYLITCDDFKQLCVWQISDLKLERLTTRALTRRAASVCVTDDEQWILVADKSGDVYQFPLVGDDDSKLKSSESTIEETKDSSNNGKENSESTSATIKCSGTLLLGHLSMLLDVVTICGDRFIATCDRDERIRVSRFPNAYNIQSFCLGHTDFVSRMAFCSDHQVLFTGGGDGYIRAWNPLTGQQLSSLLIDLESVDSTTNDGDSTSPVVSGMAWLPAKSLLLITVESCNEVMLSHVSSTEGIPVFSLTQKKVLPGNVWQAAFLNNKDACLLVLGDFEDHILECFSVDIMNEGISIQLSTSAACKSICDQVNAQTTKFKEAISKRTRLSRLRKSKIDATEDYYKRKQQRLDAKK